MKRLQKPRELVCDRLGGRGGPVDSPVLEVLPEEHDGQYAAGVRLDPDDRVRLDQDRIRMLRHVVQEVAHAVSSLDHAQLVVAGRFRPGIGLSVAFGARQEYVAQALYPPLADPPSDGGGRHGEPGLLAVPAADDLRTDSSLHAVADPFLDVRELGQRHPRPFVSLVLQSLGPLVGQVRVVVDPSVGASAVLLGTAVADVVSSPVGTLDGASLLGLHPHPDLVVDRLPRDPQEPRAFGDLDAGVEIRFQVLASVAVEMSSASDSLSSLCSHVCLLLSLHGRQPQENHSTEKGEAFFLPRCCCS